MSFSVTYINSDNYAGLEKVPPQNNADYPNLMRCNIPEIRTNHEVLGSVAPSPQDNAYFLLCPDMTNLQLNDFMLQTPVYQADYQVAPSPPPEIAPLPIIKVSQHDPKPTGETPRGQHPGFILLSVKHVKVNDAPPLIHAVTGTFKPNVLPMRKISRKRLRELTPISLNPDTIVVDKVGFITPEDATKLQQSSTLSRFRVTRIADSSSWWIPQDTLVNITVHDLRTSTLPDYVKRTYEAISTHQHKATSQEKRPPLPPDHSQHQQQHQHPQSSSTDI